MKKLLLCFFLVCGTASAQTFTGQIKMSVVVGLNVQNICKMNFGTMTATADGTCTISESGRTFTGNVVASGDFSGDTYNIKGGSGLLVGIGLPASCTVSNGVSTINIINFTSNATDGKVTLGTDGTYGLRIYATAVLPQIVSGGSYIGSYNFTAQYQ